MNAKKYGKICWQKYKYNPPGDRGLAVWYNWNKKQHAYNLMASVLEVNEQNDLDDVYTSN